MPVSILIGFSYDDPPLVSCFFFRRKEKKSFNLMSICLVVSSKPKTKGKYFVFFRRLSAVKVYSKRMEWSLCRICGRRNCWKLKYQYFNFKNSKTFEQHFYIFRRSPMFGQTHNVHYCEEVSTSQHSTYFYKLLLHEFKAKRTLKISVHCVITLNCL